METGKTIINAIEESRVIGKEFDEDKHAACSCPKTIRMLPFGRCLLLLVTVGVILSCACSTTAVSYKNTLGCKPFMYAYNTSKTIISNGKLMPCFGTVAVWICYGRCDTYEVGDYKMPFKISNHTVCTYTATKTRMVRLKYCHPEHPDPYVEVFDATGCSCSVCNPDYMSCENLNG